MDDDDYYNMHHDSRILFEAMMYAGAFRLNNSVEQRCSSSPNLSPVRKRSISPEYRKGEVQVLPCERFRGGRVNYSEIADKNARELIREEELIKLKAEKKKAKKERQKQKKRELNEHDSTTSNNNPKIDSIINSASNDMEKLRLNSNKDSETLDLNAAFMSKAVKKVKIAPVIPEKPQQKNEVKDINSLIKTAKDYEKSQQYKEAVQYISSAINLAPKRFDLILKRSYIYYELAKFEKSIRDAQKVIQYSPKNSEAYYRLGEAHFALNNLAEAETAFTKLISLNSNIDEAKQRLFSIQIKHLENMGYHPNEAYAALLHSKNKTLNEALDVLITLKNNEENNEDLYYSDEDESEESEEDESEEDSDHAGGASGNSDATALKSAFIIDKRSRILIDPSNPLKCGSLFVGNLKEGITNQELNDVFVKFGDIKSIKLTRETNCCYAFVNYTESSAAGQAMKALQGSRWLLSTVPLLIKYPTNIINSIIPTLKDPQLIDKLKASSSLKSMFQPTVVQPCDMKSSPVKPFGGTRPRPLPKTEECYFWRTTGCDYGESCFNLHIPANRGIALNVRKSLFL